MPRVLCRLFLLCLPLLSIGCGTLPKSNIPHTLISGHTQPVDGFTAKIPREQRTVFLSFQELKALAQEPSPGGALEDKLLRFFNRPIISNSAWFEGLRPTRAQNGTLGEFLRVATWNIEKSIHAQQAAQTLGSATEFAALIDPALAPPGSKEHAELMRQRERLVTADVILLQEMDIGVSRSGYRDSARDIARALGMNLAFAPMQLEIDPVMLGTQTTPELPGGDPPDHPDPHRYKGVFGLAVLSRYPIKYARCFQLQNQPYDWYASEQAETSLLEDSRRLAAEIIFENETVREMKVGGRIFFQVDLEVPGLPGNTLSIIHNHLEIKARPRDREAQMVEILSHIQHLPHTVVMAGDHNSSNIDLSPTSASRVIRRKSVDSETWLGLAMKVAMSTPEMANSGRVLLNNAKNFHSPLAPHIPVILPNQTRAMFDQIEDFRFADGGRFDFRGDRHRSINRSAAKLANSNERALKGHAPTFTVRRPIGPFGRTRLDWIFVKAPPSAQPDSRNSYRLAPHFGEALPAFGGHGLTLRLSDHSPCVVDIPLQEPPGL